MNDHLVTYPGELGTGVRVGGLWKPGQGRKPIWSGRPPVGPAGEIYRTLCLAARTGNAGTVGSTVQVVVEAGNADGGRIRRQFRVGGGLSAELRVGSFRSVSVVTGSVGVPADTEIYFAWTQDTRLDPSVLYDYLDYPVANVITALPEGTSAIYPQAACTLTWQIPEFASTFAVAAPAGERQAALWGAFSANVVTRFIVEQRGI